MQEQRRLLQDFTLEASNTYIKENGESTANHTINSNSNLMAKYGMTDMESAIEAKMDRITSQLCNISKTKKLKLLTVVN